MNLDIIIVYMQRYKHGHEYNFVPPITGIHLAALTPARHHVRVIHQQVERVDFETDAEVIALAFFSGFAPEAYRLARAFKRRGKKVIAGGPHVSFWADEALANGCDAVVIGEAESVWAQVLEDAERGALQSKYFGAPTSLEHLPTPRYDLLAPRFFVHRVVQATRGCPFSCSFCSVPAINPGFRARPIADVLRDIDYNNFKHWWQKKVVWFWDDNLTAQRAYIKELLRAMIPLDKWWLTQASMDIARDPELLDLMQRSGCIGVFFGIESFGSESLKDANKRQNKIAEYKNAIEQMHARGIAVMAGFIAGFDGDTRASIVEMAHQLNTLGVDVPFLSILTPYKGTPLYDQLDAQNRLLPERGWQFYNGYNVAFQPKQMSANELLAAHRELWSTAFAPVQIAQRIVHNAPRLNLGARFLSLAMNSFYGAKALRGNAPLDARAMLAPTRIGPFVGQTTRPSGEFMQFVGTAMRVARTI
jgi:radical SAM superfamily enzyme YgiQ (UPF0313 family)